MEELDYWRLCEELNTDAVFQNAREVKTKFSKTFTTCFFPVGDEIREAANYT